ncbi:MAG TPA: S16 family serine protease [Actinomycetota bacterium]
MKHPFRIVALATLFVLAFGAAYVRLPFYAEGPGPAREVQPMIDVGDEPRYDSAGKLIMTTVSWYPLTALQAVRAWLDPNLKIVAEDVIYPPGVDHDAEEQRSRSEMDQSKIDATMVVLRELAGYPGEHGDGALIQGTSPACPAFNRLFPGDLIVAIGGEDIETRRQASRAIDEVPPRDPVTFTVQAAGETHDVKVTRERCVDENPEPLIGISIVQAFPFPVEISSGDVGGPSAGLMFALGLYDVLTPGDLTGGRTIAGTGAIFADGTVAPIGGITDKVVAAERVGATVFLVPQQNMAELKGVDVGDLQLVGVSSFDEALAALQELQPAPS